MFGALTRGLLLYASVSLAMLSAARAHGPLEIHREAVDEQSYPWSAIGKLFTEGGSECSGVLISSDKVLTAAHCLFNYRSQKYIPADALHFLVGYRTGRYSAHVRIASYEIGIGFDPLHYEKGLQADWAILTVIETLPASIQPLRLRRELAPTGTKAILVGYPQDRSLAMTADRNCELRENIYAGWLLLHTCRGIKGYSGAPILVSAEGGEMQIAGIQIGSFRSNGIEKMIAVPAQAIEHRHRDELHELATVVAPTDSETVSACGGPGDFTGPGDVPLEAIRVRLGIEDNASLRLQTNESRIGETRVAAHDFPTL
jgi:protease YdgD